MKNSKKILSGLLAFTMMASLTACGGGSDSNSGNAGGNGGADTTAPA